MRFVEELTRPLSHLRGESIEEREPEVHQSEGEVFVEEVAEELAHADVGPASVDQQKTLKITELSKRVIAGHHRLHPLLTANPHANVCSCKGSWDGMLAVQFNRYMQTSAYKIKRLFYNY